ncbi:hypothetical protein [Chitinophaga sp.]|uniref:nSTAND1 domain-containing NTPase n=1 Tax=Chitinophaga sp. TaxID=1869181 RepID=UPI002CF872E5|nr:hypothetical protein [Chitinophaga sp.]HWV67639.1 hypothetical protein [Chitinophaga sp.]
MSITYKRYPGIVPFKRSESALFKGRNTERQQLFSMVRANALSVIFGKSGTGKSSLINAGLCPLLEENEFLPLDIRFQWADKNKSPLEDVADYLSSYANKNLPPEGFETTDQQCLWFLLKTCKFPLGTVPVLIFDQFEELLNIEDKDQKIKFLTELRDLINTAIPDTIAGKLAGIPPEKRTRQQVDWCTQPDCRVLIGIRSDRFYELNRLGNIIPQIMWNRFELGPLDLHNAADAIRLPALTDEVPSPPYTPPYTYSEDALQHIIGRLSSGKDYVETTYLQILCSELEDNLLNGKVKGTDEYGRKKVSLEDVTGNNDVGNVLDNFYRNHLLKLGNPDEIKTCRFLLEENLLFGGKRTLLSEDQVLSFLKNNNRLLNKLQEFRLIKGEYRDEQKMYEISHDVLIKSIVRLRDERRREEQKKKKVRDEQRHRMLMEQKEAEIERERKQGDQLRKAILRAKVAQNEMQLQMAKTKRMTRIVFFAVVTVALLIISGLVMFVIASRKNKKLLNLNYKTAALSNYNNGFHMLGYRLWQLAGEDPGKFGDSVQSRHLLAPFCGKNVRISASGKYILTKDRDNIQYQWAITDSGIVKLERFSNDQTVIFLPQSDRLAIVDTAYTFTTDSPGERIPLQEKFDFSNSKPITGNAYLERTTNDSGTIWHQFYSLKTGKKLPVLAKEVKKLAKQARKFAANGFALNEPYSHFELDSNKILINCSLGAYLANLTKDSLYKLSPIRPGSFVNQGFYSQYLPIVNNSVLTVYDITGRPQIKYRKPGYSARAMPDGFVGNNSKLVVRDIDVHGDTESMELWLINMDQTIPKKVVDIRITSMYVFPQYNKIAYLTSSNICYLYDAATESIISKIPNVSNIYNVDDIPDILQINSGDKYLLYNIAENKILKTVSRYDGNREAAVNTYGNRYMSVRTGDSLTIYDFRSNKQLAKYKVAQYGEFQGIAAGRLVDFYIAQKDLRYAIFLDDKLNNIDTLQSLFGRYLNNELKALRE